MSEGVLFLVMAVGIIIVARATFRFIPPYPSEEYHDDTND